MQQYEYKFLRYQATPILSTITGYMSGWEDEINALGHCGWELVGIANPTIVIFGQSTFIEFIFKRSNDPPSYIGKKNESEERK